MLIAHLVFERVLEAVVLMLLVMVGLAVPVDVGPDCLGRHDLVRPAEVEEDGAADVLQEEDALVPPELPAQRLVDRDLLFLDAEQEEGSRELMPRDDGRRRRT